MSVSILIPYYNRYKFKKLIEYNITIQDYDDIKEVIVLDDSDDGTNLTDLDIKYKTNIFKVRRMTIGKKRNELIKKCNSKYAIFMDTDDFYLSTYISHSINVLKNNKNCYIVGSADMLFYFSDTQSYNDMNCLKLYLIHEATLCFNVKWFKKCIKFIKTNTGEGKCLKGYEKYIKESDIHKCMVCLAHNENTINKNKWKGKEDNKVLKNIIFPKIMNHLDIISKINL